MWLAGLVLAPMMVVAVRGAGSCPSPAEVEQALGEIDPRGTARDELVESVASADGAPVIRFRAADGAVLAERAVPVELSCAERARAAAVVITAHFAELPGEPQPPPRLVAVTRPAPAVRAAARRLRLEVEAAVVGALAGSSAAPGAEVGAGLWLDSADVLRLGLRYLAPHSTAVASGTGRWSRLALRLGYGRRVWTSAGDQRSIEIGGGLVASLLRVEGRGFMSNEQHTTVHPGIDLGARLGQRAGKGVRLWLGAGLGLWPRRQTLLLRDDQSAAADVPRLEAMASLGGTFGGDF